MLITDKEEQRKVLSTHKKVNSYDKKIITLDLKKKKKTAYSLINNTDILLVFTKSLQELLRQNLWFCIINNERSFRFSILLSRS